MMHVSDAHLVELYAAERTSLVGFARRLGAEDPEDAVQEVVARIVAHRPDVSSLRAYLYRAIEHEVISQHRRGARVVVDLPEEVAAERSAEEVAFAALRVDPPAGWCAGCHALTGADRCTRAAPARSAVEVLIRRLADESSNRPLAWRVRHALADAGELERGAHDLSTAAGKRLVRSGFLGCVLNAFLEHLEANEVASRYVRAATVARDDAWRQTADEWCRTARRSASGAVLHGLLDGAAPQREALTG